MAEVSIDFNRTIAASEEIIGISKRLEIIRGKVESLKLDRVLDGRFKYGLNSSLRNVLDSISDKAAKENSLGKALQVIAEKYKETEKIVCSEIISRAAEGDSNGNPGILDDLREEIGNLWNGFWKWLSGDDPHDYEDITIVQEIIADARMREKLRGVLKGEKYSPENWDRASVEERKQLLQDYMDEVIKIYGLKDVDSTIYWDSTATYEQRSITWGYYNHGSHRVTLNEQALSDRYGNWDSFLLLQTVAHELRHAYQHEAVEHPGDYMVSPGTLETWRDNFLPGHYISSGEDYDKYRAQPVEKDARAFEVGRDINPIDSLLNMI